MLLFYLMVILMCFPYYLPLYNIIGLLSMMKIVGIITFLYAIGVRFFAKGLAPLTDQPQKKLFLIYFLFGVIYIFILNYSSGGSIWNIRPYNRYISFIILFLTFTTFIRSVDIANKVMWIIVICLFINSFEAIHQARNYGGSYRAIGFFDDPNFLGSALLVAIGFSFALMNLEKKGRYQLVGVILLLIYVFAILKTMSRGVLLALLFMSVAYVVKSKIYQLNSKRKWLIIIILLIGSLLIMKRSGRELFFIDKRVQGTRIVESKRDRTSGAVGSTSDRYTILMTGLNMVKDNPGLGIGINQFKSTMENYVDFFGEMELDRNYVAHNTYLEVAAEQGVVFFIVFVSILFYTMRDLHRIQKIAIKINDEKLFTISSGLFMGFGGYLVSIMFLSAENENLFWFAIFFTMALNTISKKKIAEDVLET